MSACIFCSIVSGGTKAHVVFEDDLVMAFLDVRPLFHGHVLVVPRAHVVTLADLPDAVVGPFFTRVKDLSRAVTEACEAEGSFVAMNNVVSQSVAHLHVHVVPRKKKDGLKGFFWPRTKYESDDQMAETAAKIRKAMGQA
ncbi:Histidine triad (HIT) nucleotide-binding protein [Labilithrix luteola]|uniref:Histidine triad (HIT) nucleotide-binding protein n=1 Tax=Labilithrix luteola TaxID=1391654 RepID=A0A0K1QFE6_9BACT|nr:HIT family protein [Labilithrix luteola]AKV04155.1 Histidine triad (HIT) nucleotide-binding protein [Labilithrix luteola]